MPRTPGYRGNVQVHGSVKAEDIKLPIFTEEDSLTRLLVKMENRISDLESQVAQLRLRQ